MQIMKPATDEAYELRFYYVPVSYLFVSMAYAWRTCCVAVLNHSYVQRICTAFLYGLSLVPVFFVLVKIQS